MAKDGKVTTHHPVEPLPNTFAQIYTHMHPVVVLSTFLLRFNSLVDDPVSTLLSTAVPLAVLQTVYVVICLPSVNDLERRPKGKKGAGAQKVEEMGWGFKIVVRTTGRLTQQQRALMEEETSTKYLTASANLPHPLDIPRSAPLRIHAAPLRRAAHGLATTDPPLRAAHRAAGVAAADLRQRRRRGQMAAGAGLRRAGGRGLWRGVGRAGRGVGRRCAYPS